MRPKSKGKGGNRNAIAVFAIFASLCFSATAGATIVELDLLSLGCPTEFTSGSNWQIDFDLGTEFIEITNVYMDWSGGITAGLATSQYNPDEPFPLDVAISAYLDMPIHAGASVWGGESTYPSPEPFDRQSDFELFGHGTWSGLLDGQAKIWLYYESLIIVGGRYIESGSITLDRANLLVEGVIPEPSTLCFLSIGIFLMRHKSQRKRLN